jgi:alkaline phosphatase
MVASFIVPGTAATTPKNVIIMIADGVGYNQYLAADYYLYGKAGASTQEQFPVKLAMSTYSHGQSNAITDDTESIYNPAWWNDSIRFMFGATDSASAATAMSTGVKTFDSAIGMNQDGVPLTHVLEDFEALGKATGVITSVPFDHATPAGFVAHNINRDSYLEIGDEMIKSSNTDVIMGAGHPLFDDMGVARTAFKLKYINEATWNELVDGTVAVADANGDGTADPWSLVQTKEGFEALQTGDAPNRVFGMAPIATTLQNYRLAYAPYADPYSKPLVATVPTLETMTKGALNVLDNDKDGFFIMIEGGATDWAGHFGQGGNLIEEMEDFNKSVDAVCAWVEKNSNWNETLLIVTGDHETGYLTGVPGAYNNVINNGKGVTPTMAYNTNTLDKKWSNMYWHSNQLVPFFAKGAGATLLNSFANLKDPVRGAYLDNTEMSVAIRQLIGVAPSSWAANNVYLATDRSLVPKSLQKNYTSNITRNDFCTLAFELLKKTGVTLLTPTAEKPMPFTDTTSDVVYTLNQLGIISGKGSATTFAPNDLITRQEAAVLINNIATNLKLALQKEVSAPSYADGWTVAGWAKTAVNNAYILGVMKSTGNNSFSPLANFTTEQAICAILQLYKLKNPGDIYVWDVVR